MEFSHDKNKMNFSKREALTQLALSGLIRELDLELSLDPEEDIDENTIFDLEYRPLDRNGREKSCRRKIFNMRKCNLQKLELVIDAAMVDKLLLEREGLNLTPTLFLNDAPEYRPRPIYRRIPIDYGAFKSTPMYGIGVNDEGHMTTYIEVSWKREDESNPLFNSIRRSDPFFQLVMESHQDETKIYNENLIKSLKGVFLVETIRLSNSLIGVHKSCFDFRGLHNLKRELGHIEGVNVENYLTTNSKWLGKINDDLGGWAYSCHQIQKTELHEFQTFFKERLEKMTKNLKLEDSRFWSDEKEDLGTQIEYLKQVLFCYRILAELNANASQKLYARLRDMSADFGSLMQDVVRK